MDAALEEFTARGFAGARVEAIALRAGVRKQLLYHYFPSKEAYFVADARNHPALAAPLVEATGARSAVFEPILRDGDVCGVLIVIWQRSLDALPEASGGLLKLVASQAAIAIEHAGLRARVAALALTGWASARMSYGPPGRALLRNVGGGLLAMAVTFAVGNLLGTQV